MTFAYTRFTLNINERQLVTLQVTETLKLQASNVRHFNIDFLKTISNKLWIEMRK